MRSGLGVCAVTGAVLAACHGGSTPSTTSEGGPPTPAPAASASGFPPAVQPIADKTVIVTDSVGLDAGPIEIAAVDRSVPGYRAAPAGRTNVPIILVVQEIFGVHEHIKDVCRRLAKLGYLAVAPELFARQGDVSQLKSFDEIRGVVSRVPDAQVVSDLDAAFDWAQAHGGDPSRLAITGFCWGGRVTWLYAAHQPKLKAAVAWYGKLVGPSSPLMPKQPIDVAADLKAPVLGLYGGKDDSIPLDTVESFRGALRKASSPSTIQVYPDAGHAFFADYRPNYRKEAAEDGWKRFQAWLHEHGM
jgi:carboxymethylenebutenolidase